MSWLLCCCLLGGWPMPVPTPTVDTLYGTYIIPDEQISLNLSPPNYYTLFVLQYDERGGAVSSQELSRGQFRMLEDTVVLEDITTGKAMKLHASSEERLHPVDVPGLEEDVTFLGHNQYYANGELKWEGEWRKGKKHGTWVYYDRSGNVVETIRYRRGKERD